MERLLEKNIKPEVTISSFSEKDVKIYIEDLENIQSAFGPSQPLLLKIDSFGGSAYGFIMLYEYLITLENPIVTYTTSKAISAGALLLSIAGTSGLRFASPHSSILVHELQSALFPDDIKNLENNLDNIKRLNETIMGLMAKSMGLKTAKDVRNLIKERSTGHDLNLTAYEAKELGIIDEVAYIKLSPVVAYNVIQSLPEELKKPEIKITHKQPKKIKKSIDRIKK
jgi:ATP-dependent protease ClpP protease subunit